MAPTSIFQAEHADFLARLLPANLSYDQLAAQMSMRFKIRITPGQVGRLLTRMRNTTDEFYRAAPYRKAGSRFNG